MAYWEVVELSLASSGLYSSSSLGSYVSERRIHIGPTSRSIRHEFNWSKQEARIYSWDKSMWCGHGLRSDNYVRGKKNQLQLLWQLTQINLFILRKKVSWADPGYGKHRCMCMCFFFHCYRSWVSSMMVASKKAVCFSWKLLLCNSEFSLLWVDLQDTRICRGVQVPINLRSLLGDG